jgi:hypothetical protein
MNEINVVRRKRCELNRKKGKNESRSDPKEKIYT